MTDEIEVLLEIVTIFDGAGIDYMLTGSVAMNMYATPRMTRDIDIVGAVFLRDVARIGELFPAERFYVSEDAARDAVINQSSFNILHLGSMMKLDIMIRKREEYRLLEFGRRRTLLLRGRPIWIVSREDLILSKLDWSRDSESERQMEDVRNLLAGDCDLAYLDRWATKLDLTATLTRAMA